MGTISIGKIAIDGTKLKANASHSKTIKGKELADEISDNPTNYWGLKVMVEQIKENTRRKPERMLADSGYDSYDDPAYLKETGITGYIANQTKQGIERRKLANAEFDRSNFVHDAGENIYRCPITKSSCPKATSQGNRNKKMKAEADSISTHSVKHKYIIIYSERRS